MVLNTEEIEEKKNTGNEHDDKSNSNGMPVYDINELWVQKYIEDFGSEPSFF